MVQALAILNEVLMAAASGSHEWNYPIPWDGQPETLFEDDIARFLNLFCFHLAS